MRVRRSNRRGAAIAAPLRITIRFAVLSSRGLFQGSLRLRNQRRKTRGIVHGDICQDLATGGAAFVTMVQRSATCVVSRENIRKHVHNVWAPGVPVYVGDFKYASMPVGLLREIMISSQDAQWAEEKELHAKLAGSGLKLTLGADGQGHAVLVYERGGGPLFVMSGRGVINIFY